MATLIVSLTFATVYAVSAATVTRIRVYWFGLWDRKFVHQAGSVAVADQVLPILVALATLSFLAGLSTRREVVTRVALAAVAVAGATCGLAAAVLLLAEPILRQLGAPPGLAAAVGIVMFWAGPAALAAVSFRMLGHERPPKSGPTGA